MITYNCQKCFHRIRHDFGPYYTCTYCGLKAYHNKIKRSETPPRFYEYEDDSFLNIPMAISL